MLTAIANSAKESPRAMDYCQGIEERGLQKRAGILPLCAVGTRRDCKGRPLCMDEFKGRRFRRIQESSCDFFIGLFIAYISLIVGTVSPLFCEYQDFASFSSQTTITVLYVAYA